MKKKKNQTGVRRARGRLGKKHGARGSKEKLEGHRLRRGPGPLQALSTYSSGTLNKKEERTPCKIFPNDPHPRLVLLNEGVERPSDMRKRKDYKKK